MLQHKSGFTLIELMIAVAIIGILTAIAIPTYNQYISNAKTNVAQNTLAQFPVLLESYRTDTGFFSPDCNSLTNCSHTYSYEEDDSGNITVNTITTFLPDFTPRGNTYPKDRGILYNYQLTISINCSQTPCTESAIFTATPISSRGAPTGILEETYH